MDRADWRRVTQRRFAARAVDSPDFCGYVTLFGIDAVREPLWMPCAGEMVCVADTGYVWLTHIPHGEHFALITMFDAQGAVVQWYADIIGGQGVDERGIPWYDDLYLDVVATPGGQVEIIDAADLDEALADGRITADEHALAWRAAHRVRDLMLTGDWPLLRLGQAHRALFEGLAGDTESV